MARNCAGGGIYGMFCREYSGFALAGAAGYAKLFEFELVGLPPLTPIGPYIGIGSKVELSDTLVDAGNNGGPCSSYSLYSSTASFGDIVFGVVSSMRA